MATPDTIIQDINTLTDAEKRELALKLRTSEEGIKAYTATLFGVTMAASKVEASSQTTTTTP